MTAPTTPLKTTTRGFQADLLRLLARHRYAGVPGRVATTIRTAAAASDQETLREWVPSAVAQMMKHAERRS